MNAAEQLGEDADDAEVIIGIETDRGPWVAALVAAGYAVYGVNPLQASRYRGRHGVSGAKSDRGDAHMLADMVRTDSHQLRPAAGDSPQAEGIKVLARTHKTLIWERTRQVQRLRHQLLQYYPAAIEAFPDLDAPDALELLRKAPDPARAARLTRAQVAAALSRARRRDVAGKTNAVLAALRSPQLGQPAALTAAYAATSCGWNDMNAAFMSYEGDCRGGGGGHWSAQETLRHHRHRRCATGSDAWCTYPSRQ